MLTIENVDICGWEPAIRGMRNPMNSWGKSDSDYSPALAMTEGFVRTDDTDASDNPFCIGPNDQKLVRKLASNGTADHRKFMRMITVYLDITAPLYWWKEFDTYKVGTVANSCSTMHKLAAKEFTLDDFSHEHLIGLSESFEIWRENHDLDPKIDDDDPAKYPEDANEFWSFAPLDVLCVIIKALNHYRELYLKTKDKKYWWQMIQILPTSYNQKRTVMLNYEVLRNIYTSRRHHKLDEWHTLCDWIEALPMSDLMTGETPPVWSDEQVDEFVNQIHEIDPRITSWERDAIDQNVINLLIEEENILLVMDTAFSNFSKERVLDAIKNNKDKYIPWEK